MMVKLAAGEEGGEGGEGSEDGYQRVLVYHALAVSDREPLLMVAVSEVVW